MKTVIFSIIAIVVVLAATAGVNHFLEVNKPEAAKKERVETIPVVKVALVKMEDLEFSLKSEGVVMTRRQTVLSSQVGGRIVEVHPQFEVGATFKVGAVIAKIDRLDYETAVAQAKSVLADAKLSLVQEEARGEQAARDWKKIGGGKAASELVLRVPFLKSAEARVVATEAALGKAIEDLERTVIRAPFDCRVREVVLNLGATVAPGSQLGMSYDAENLMIRLPFSLDDYAQIPKAPGIKLFTEIGGKRYEWKGEVMWDLGEVDQATASAYLLVNILPNKEAEPRFRLPSSGQFLKARLSGAKLPGVLAVPRVAVRGRAQVGVLTVDGTLTFRTLTIVRSDEGFVYAAVGVSGGPPLNDTTGILPREKVILTKLELPVEGMMLTEAKPEKPAED